MSKADSTSRLFLALWPETHIQDAMQGRRDGCTLPHSASLVLRKSMHLTLHFLGSVPDLRLPELTQELKVPFRPFDLSFSSLNVWPHGVVVLEPDSVPDGLLKLHHSLAAALKRLELPIETRDYHPHVTLARHAVGVPSALHTTGKPIHWHVHSYALMKSMHAPVGTYSLVQSYR